MNDIRAIISRHSLREALIGSFNAAIRNGVALNAASLAGRALTLHDDIDVAIESVDVLQRAAREGREDGRVTEYEWALCGASTYLSKVAAEERGQSAAPDRYMAGRSDEGDGRG
jgi:hypothetical protein